MLRYNSLFYMRQATRATLLQMLDFIITNRRFKNNEYYDDDYCGKLIIRDWINNVFRIGLLTTRCVCVCEIVLFGFFCCIDDVFCNSHFRINSTDTRSEFLTANIIYVYNTSLCSLYLHNCIMTWTVCILYAGATGRYRRGIYRG